MLRLRNSKDLRNFIIELTHRSASHDHVLWPTGQPIIHTRKKFVLFRESGFKKIMQEYAKTTQRDPAYHVIIQSQTSVVYMYVYLYLYLPVLPKTRETATYYRHAWSEDKLFAMLCTGTCSSKNEEMSSRSHKMHIKGLKQNAQECVTGHVGHA